ncbi:RHS repeat-associated core domain-containing protein [Photobacterium kagoshimensis]|uniref:RHS repeat-associated core domain-containing protein n=1 Tax=Photobacterium kagoshimensis TaxID=2910242 RepID=UPI003D1007AE
MYLWLCWYHDRKNQKTLRYQGQYFDDESGLHYNRFRYYDPITGRFIHQDPLAVAWDTLYTVVDAAYYPIDIVTRPLGLPPMQLIEPIPESTTHWMQRKS